MARPSAAGAPAAECRQVLYIGHAVEAAVLDGVAARRGWQVHRPRHWREALSMFVTYAPQLVVVAGASGGCPPELAPAIRHLQELGAPLRDLVAVATDAPGAAVSPSAIPVVNPVVKPMEASA